VEQIVKDNIQAPSTRAPMAWRPVLAVAAVAAAIHLAVATRYGWHHDEFYYVICGRHLAWGYVDQPPLTPFLARLATSLPGGLLPLRLLAIAAQVGCVLVAPVLAAEFGGGRRAQLITAAAIAACPAFVGASLLFGTTVVDQFVWTVLFVLIARAFRLGTVRAWLYVGVAAGIGLENKDTAVVLLIGVAAGMVAYRRETLRTAGPWLAAVVAVALALPNVIWNAQHGWPDLAMDHVLSREQGGTLGGIAQIPALALLLAGPPLIALWVIGVRWLGSGAGREHRWVLAAAVAVVVLFALGGGKDYYAAPSLTGLFAAGAVRVEASWRRGAPLRWSAAVVGSGVIAVVIGLPVLPASAATALRPVNPQLMQTYGWPQFTAEVNRAAHTLPAATPIFTSDYGEAGALTILGPAAGLHNPVYSDHNNYYFWGPPPGQDSTVLCVGKFTLSYLHGFWSSVRKIGLITFPSGLKNNETANGAAIYLCRQPHGTWAQMWSGLRHYD
jgi:Dolichyl-phosphate-mannose-protein mannosyltransferase